MHVYDIHGYLQIPSNRSKHLLISIMLQSMVRNPAQVQSACVAKTLGAGTSTGLYKLSHVHPKGRQGTTAMEANFIFTKT